MPAAKFDFRNSGSKKNACEQGATFRREFLWKEKSVGATEATPIDLTSYTARMQVRTTHKSENTIISITTENGGIVLGGPLGTVNLYMSAIQTAALPAREYVYDVELIAPTGDVIRLVEGTFEVTPEVTR